MAAYQSSSWARWPFFTCLPVRVLVGRWDAALSKWRPAGACCVQEGTGQQGQAPKKVPRGCPSFVLPSIPKERADVEVHMMGSYKFKGNPEPIEMVGGACLKG